ncbi:hypothetical protein Dda_6098 [Drechslerella dactyloides]|uniref:Uncharacterized protein n=1 Tax=Drechslerella dactyloides TaxID=74499 RepID=A0AAD6IX44_DREDA|nr:hypothetical protein Dda_6098 [Drechslerella dactyloides]
MGDRELVSCSSLAQRNSFEGYIDKIRNFTGEGGFDQLGPCKTEICGSLWGAVNADIAGVGVTASYIIANCLSLLCVVGVIVYWEASNRLGRSLFSAQIEDGIAECIKALYASILWLCASIQIASIVLLVGVDFGIAAAGIEFPTMEITWTVSVLTMLPLLQLTFLPEFQKISYSRTHAHTRFATDDREMYDLPPHMRNVRKECERESVKCGNFRFRLKALIICWFLSIYPFLSRMLETFAPSKIGDEPGNVISTTDWGAIENLCLSDVERISESHRTTFMAFGIAGWLWITIYTALCLVRLFYYYREGPNSRGSMRLERSMEIMPADVDIGAEGRGMGEISPIASWRSKMRLGSVRCALIVVTPLLVGFNLWAVFRLQRYQSDIASQSSNGDGQADWGFGQIVAIMIFAPVALEIYRVVKVHVNGRRKG